MECKHNWIRIATLPKGTEVHQCTVCNDRKMVKKVREETDEHE